MRSVISPGELKESLKIIKNQAEGQYDVNGFPVETAVTLFTLRCKKKTISTREFVSANKQSSIVQFKFIVNKRNIDNTMKIEYKQKLYDIKHVHEIDEFYIELTAEETGGA